MSGSVVEETIYIGIDAGTSGIRACAIAGDANILFEAARPWPAPQHSNKTISQDPNIWARELFALLADFKSAIDLRHVTAIAIDGTSGTVMLTDSKGVPLTHALLYNDASSAAQVSRLKIICPELLVTHSVAAGLPKILQLATLIDASQVGHVMHQADWLAFQLTLRAGHSDANNCLKTGYDAQQHRWPSCIKQLASITTWLPQVHQSGEDLAPIAPTVAVQHGLSEHTMIRAGTTDSTAAVVATGAQRIGDAITSLGSTLVMKIICDKPIFETQYGIYSQPYGDYWLVGGGSNSGGAVLRHYFTDDQMQELSKQINPEHDTGLQYYPLQHKGERFPLNDPELAPKISPRPDNDVTFFQGLLEGMAQIEYNAYQRLAELGAPYPQRIFSVGGGAVNEQWTRIRQRYLQAEMKTSLHTSAAYGSALIARQRDIKEPSQ